MQRAPRRSTRLLRIGGFVRQPAENRINSGVTLWRVGDVEASYMPRFYFDVFDGETTTLDKIGLHVEDNPKQVRDLAIDALPDIAREKLPDGDSAEFSVTVRDEDGFDIFCAILSFRAEWIGRTKG